MIEDVQDEIGEVLLRLRAPGAGHGFLDLRRLNLGLGIPGATRIRHLRNGGRSALQEDPS